MRYRNLHFTYLLTYLPLVQESSHNRKLYSDEIKRQQSQQQQQLTYTHRCVDWRQSARVDGAARQRRRRNRPGIQRVHWTAATSLLWCPAQRHREI